MFLTFLKEREVSKGRLSLILIFLKKSINPSAQNDIYKI